MLYVLQLLGTGHGGWHTVGIYTSFKKTQEALSLIYNYEYGRYDVTHVRVTTIAPNETDLSDWREVALDIPCNGIYKIHKMPAVPQEELERDVFTDVAMKLLGKDPVAVDLIKDTLKL